MTEGILILLLAAYVGAIIGLATMPEGRHLLKAALRYPFDRLEAWAKEAAK